MTEQNPETRLTLKDFLKFISELVKTDYIVIRSLLWSEELTLEEGKKAHVEEVIPFHLGWYLRYSKKKGVQITSLGQKIIVRALGMEDDTSFVVDWEQIVNRSQHILNGEMRYATRQDYGEALFILQLNRRIRDNEKSIIEFEKNSTDESQE